MPNFYFKEDQTMKAETSLWHMWHKFKILMCNFDWGHLCESIVVP